MVDLILFSPPFSSEGVNKNGKNNPVYQQTGFAKCEPYSDENIAFKGYGK